MCPRSSGLKHFPQLTDVHIGFMIIRCRWQINRVNKTETLELRLTCMSGTLAGCLYLQYVKMQKAIRQYLYFHRKFNPNWTKRTCRTHTQRNRPIFPKICFVRTKTHSDMKETDRSWALVILVTKSNYNIKSDKREAIFNKVSFNNFHFLIQKSFCTLLK